MVISAPLEVAQTVLEFAEVAWTAMECCHHYNHQHHHDDDAKPQQETTSSNPPPESNQEKSKEEQELESLRSENRRLRNLLEQNLKLLENISQSPSVSQSCPLDLHERIISAVKSKSFLDKLEVDSGCSDCKFPFDEVSGEDLEKAEILINIDQKDPSWWVWIPDGTTPTNIDAHSEIDCENYVIINEEHVVDGVANFMAKCIMSNPKAKDLSPQELQQALTRALEGVNKLERVVHVWTAGKMFYTLSTWGLALAGLYRTRAVLKFAAMGVHASSKAVMKAL